MIIQLIKNFQKRKFLKTKENGKKKICLSENSLGRKLFSWTRIKKKKPGRKIGWKNYFFSLK